MKNRQKLVAGLIFILAIGATKFIHDEGRTLFYGNDNLNDSVVNVVSARNNKTFDLQADTMVAIAKSHNVTVAEFEKLIVDGILLQRQQIKNMSGGYDTGIHIIKSKDSDRIDPEAIRLVAGVMNFDDMKGGGGFKSPEGFANDKNIYIEAVDDRTTDLTKAKFTGYATAGKYLTGNAYAQTEQLRKLEATPSGKTGWTGLTRIYSNYENLGTVVLEESDYLAEGGIVLIPEGSLNAKVGAYPATLSRSRDHFGKTMTHLDWTDKDQHNYSLNIRQTDDASVASLMRLAESIAGVDR